MYCKTCGEIKLVDIPKDKWDEARVLFLEARDLITHKCSGQYELRKYAGDIRRKNQKTQVSANIQPLSDKNSERKNKERTRWTPRTVKKNQ